MPWNSNHHLLSLIGFVGQKITSDLVEWFCLGISHEGAVSKSTGNAVMKAWRAGGPTAKVVHSWVLRGCCLVGSSLLWLASPRTSKPCVQGRSSNTFFGPRLNIHTITSSVSYLLHRSALMRWVTSKGDEYQEIRIIGDHRFIKPPYESFLKHEPISLWLSPSDTPANILSLHLPENDRTLVCALHPTHAHWKEKQPTKTFSVAAGHVQNYLRAAQPGSTWEIWDLERTFLSIGDLTERPR